MFVLPDLPNNLCSKLIYWLEDFACPTKKPIFTVKIKRAEKMENLRPKAMIPIDLKTIFGAVRSK